MPRAIFVGPKRTIYYDLASRPPAQFAPHCNLLTAGNAVDSGTSTQCFLGQSGEARPRRGGSGEEGVGRWPVMEAWVGARFAGRAMEEEVEAPDLAAEAPSTNCGHAARTEVSSIYSQSSSYGAACPCVVASSLHRQLLELE